MAAPGVLQGSNDNEKLNDLCSKTHKDQAVWFLNAFWEDFAEKEAENIWNFVDHAQNIDNAKAAGTALDEMEAHRFLEKADSAHTVLEMRNLLRKSGAIGQSERPKTVPLTHYFLFKYDAQSSKLFHDLVTRSQGDNREAIEEAQRKLDAVQSAFDEASRTAAAAAASLKEAQAREADAKKSEDAAKAREADAVARENDAKAAEASAHASADAAKAKEAEAKKSAENLAVREEELKAAQLEVEAALAEVKKQEDAYNAKTEDLKKRSEEGGVVSKNKAKNELAQHLAEDPLPLRTAKITAEAAVRKAEKATKAAADARVQAEADAIKASESRKQAEADAVKASESRKQAEAARAEAVAAREAAEAARKQAEAARAAAEKDKQAADDAVDAAQAAVAEAEAFLEEIKAQPGASQGALWWMDRELHEKKKYMPMRKGGIAK